MLKQFASVPIPLMRKAIVLAFIAPGARDHKVVRAIRPVSIKRDNMVNVVCFTNGLIAPITMPLLAFILALYIFRGVDSLRLLFLGLPIAPVDTFGHTPALTLAIATGCFSALSWVAFTALSIVFRLRTRPNRFFNTLLWVAFIPFALISAYAALVGGIVPALIEALTLFTLRTTTISALGRSVVIRPRLGNTAAGTRFHSASLSLYHKMLSADGVISRRSVASLADKLNYTARLAGAPT